MVSNCNVSELRKTMKGVRTSSNQSKLKKILQMYKSTLINYLC